MSPGAGETVPVVRVGPFDVADLSRSDAVAWLVQCAREGRRIIACDLHVQAFNVRSRRSFTEAAARADLLYADGVSVVLVARAAGASRIERTPLTEIGHEVLDGLAAALPRRPRVALIGGQGTVAEEAGKVLAAQHGVEVSAVAHGYHREWCGALKRIRATRPDILFIGMGIPREVEWVHRHLRDLPDCLVMTCGGWFGFVVGAERRAPKALRRLHLEWLGRLVQSPRRLFPRYVRGAFTVALLVVDSVWRRVRRRGAVAPRAKGPGR